MTHELLRKLPSLDHWLKSRCGSALCREFSLAEVTAAMRSQLDAVRSKIASGDAVLPDFQSEAFEQFLRCELLGQREISIRPVINATGIVIHTNLGRAPLAPEAIAAMESVAKGYSNLEYELSSGRRGSRNAHVESLLTALTGAEAAVVVNNCAAAVNLALKTFATDGEVLVSRGELIEIGGSFRMPDVIAQSGAIMREIGTTNRTTIADYAREISDRTRVLLTSHPSNYRVVGFTAKPSLAEVVRLAHAHDCLCIQDLGSGTLVDLSAIGLEAEPTVGQCIESGADLVMFSGDKLLGGPQAGIICGRRDLVDTLKRHPLLRAMRIDKLSLAALAATLRLYQPPHDPFGKIPVLRMLALDEAAIEPRARAVAKRMSQYHSIDAHAESGVSFAGGGSLPMNEIRTIVIRLRVAGIEAHDLAAKLRDSTPAVVGRIKDDDLLIDLRTVDPNDDELLQEAVARAIA